MPRCFVIASGPSLEGFDFRRLDNDVTIGLNYIFRYYTPTILHWIDPVVYQEHKKRIDLIDCVKVAPDRVLGDAVNVYGVRMVNRGGLFNGRSGLELGLYCRWLCGSAGISLAVALGFTPVYLLGMDCSIKGDQTHFYTDFRHKGSNRKNFYGSADSIKIFNRFKGWPDIYNCSTTSAIKVFPGADINEVLKQPTPQINQVKIRTLIHRALKARQPIW